MKQVIKEILLQLFPKSKELHNNYEILKREVEKVGREYEKKSYQELLRPAEQNFTIRMIAISLREPAKLTTRNESTSLAQGEALRDRKIYFNAEAYHVKPDGTLCFCIDADGLPTIFGVKPSYHFYKRPDNSVYY